jgi:hypothetical protein
VEPTLTVVSWKRGPFAPNGSVAALSVHEQIDPRPHLGPRQNEVDIFATSNMTGQVLVSREISGVGAW